MDFDYIRFIRQKQMTVEFFQKLISNSDRNCDLSLRIPLTKADDRRIRPKPNQSRLVVRNGKKESKPRNWSVEQGTEGSECYQIDPK